MIDNNDKDNFKDYVNKYDQHRKIDDDIVNLLEEIIGFDKSKKILDYGCGTGNYLKALQQKGYYNLYGLDKSKDMIFQAIQKTNLIILQGDENNIPYEENSFDFIFMIDVIHFIEKIDSLFEQFSKILKKEGKVFIATQSYTQLENRVYAKYFPTAEIIDKHRHYDINVLTNEASKYLLKVENIINFKNNTDYLVDDKYLSLILNKAFYILRLIPDDELDNGIKMLKEDLKNGPFIAKFPGRTLLVFSKE